MMTILLLMIENIFLVSAGCFLVYTEHYAWAWIPFLFINSWKIKK